MGNFSLDKYQQMKPLFVEALDASKTVDILNHAQQQAALAANIKKTPAVVGSDTYNRDILHNQYADVINKAADAEGNPLDKQSYVKKLAAEYVNNPMLEAYGKSDAQKNDYDTVLVDRVKKADIKSDDADLASQAALLAHNYKGGTNPETGNYFANSLYNVPNLVDEQGIVKDIVATPDGYRTENQSIIKYDPATGEIFSRSVVNGKEYFNQGREVGEYLYANNEKGIRDRHIWDAKKEVANQLVRDGKYKSQAEAFIAVDNNTNGDFTNRLNERVLEKKSRFINSLVAQKDFLQQERATKENINPAATGGAASKEPTELVIDSRPDVHTQSFSDDELNNLDLDKFVQEYKTAQTAGVNEDSKMSQLQAAKLGLVGGIYGPNNPDMVKQAKSKHAEFIKTVNDFRAGRADVLKKYGYTKADWDNLSKSEQDNKIKDLIRQRRNTTSTVGILEGNNTNVYKAALDNANEIFVFDHNKNNYEKVDRKDFKAKYLNNGGWFSSSLSEQDMKQLKQNSGFKSNNESASIDSYEEYSGHAASKTPVLAFDFTGYKVKPYLQFNAGDNNSSVRVPISDITESALVPIQNAFKEFKNPTGNSVKIASHIGLSSGGQYKEYNDLTAKWVNGTYTIFSGGNPTSLTLEKLAMGMVGSQINNLNTTANTAKTKQNNPTGGQ